MTGYGQSGQMPEIQTRAELQKHVLAGSSEEHSDWIEPNGDCSTYTIYEKRFAELPVLFAAKRR
jgi:hypothetical protein